MNFTINNFTNYFYKNNSNSINILIFDNDTLRTFTKIITFEDCVSIFNIDTFYMFMEQCFTNNDKYIHNSLFTVKYTIIEKEINVTFSQFIENKFCISQVIYLHEKINENISTNKNTIINFLELKFDALNNKIDNLSIDVKNILQNKNNKCNKYVQTNKIITNNNEKYKFESMNNKNLKNKIINVDNKS